MSTKSNILYIDDEAINLSLFEIHFSKISNVITVNSGIKGLKILDRNKDIKLVVCDMHMPEMNGLEFVNNANKRYPQIVYYILTGYEITENIQEAIENKIIDKYFSKPLDIEKMKASIEKVLSSL